MFGGVKRTVLYYPTIDIPNKKWLRQALLYWDNVASIVPFVMEGILIPFNPEIGVLLDYKLFKPINPEKLVRERYKLVRDLEKELRDIVESPRYQRFIGPSNNWIINSRIHVSKVSDSVIKYLQNKKLASTNIRRDNEGSWYMFETKTALLFMSLLARYLAEIEKEYTVPSTENIKYEHLIFSPLKNDVGMICALALFKNILPVPGDDVAIEEIIGFREDYRADLLRFRKRVRGFQDDLSKAQNQNEIKDITTAFAEERELGINEIIEALEENKIQFRLDSLQTVVKTPTLATAIASGSAVLLGKICGIDIPLEWGAIPPATTGTIEIVSHYIKSKMMKSALLRKSAFSYIYHAEKALT